MSFVWKVFAGMVAAILLAGFVIDLAVVGEVRDGLREEINGHVRRTTPLIAGMVDFDAERGVLIEDQLARVVSSEPDIRITIIDLDGRVLFDSHELSEAMENHGQRPEVLDPGTIVTRYSNTLQTFMTYHALEIVRDGRSIAYARVALPQEDIESRISALRVSILLSVLLGLAVAFGAAFVISRRLTRPLSDVAARVRNLGRGETLQRLPILKQDEVGELSSAINRMADELEARVEVIAKDHRQKDAILAGMSEGLIAVDHEQKVMLINSAARRLISLSEDEPIGRSLWELTRITEITKAVDGCIEEGIPTVEEISLSEEHSDLVLRLAAAPFREDQGDSIGCVLVLQDLTELRRLEKVRRDFVANVSHELKTPLTAIHGFVEVLHDDPEMETGQRHSFLTKALAATERLSAILRDLFSLARIEAADGALAKEPVDLGGLTANCLREARAAAEIKGMKLEMHSPAQPISIIGDPEALATAVSNLLDNAIKYSPEGSQVDLFCDLDDGSARIRVRDQGPGIPASAQERVFERFYRVDKDRSRILGGTGLGLSIVRNVLSAHGGEVSLESEVGKGSEFTIKLPA
ncbi:MAG: ATP-binding protein [Planctomycetota bacterium]